MPQELRSFVVNMKSLDQDIADPIVAGAGDANGRSFRVIFTQEAKAQKTPDHNSKEHPKHLHRCNSKAGTNELLKDRSI